MRIAIMQPYFFPYIGYFQLIKSVDKFIFYDDVNYIKGGWINRNNILINCQKNLFTIPLCGASSNRRINEIHVDTDNRKFKVFLKKIRNAYQKAPFFDAVYPMILGLFESYKGTIAQLAGESIIRTLGYLSLDRTIEYSSKSFEDSIHFQRDERLINICRIEGASQYINPIGGKELYETKNFQEQGIKLSFLEPKIEPYLQFGGEFISGLSIIDVLMFNSPQKIVEMLNKYDLE